MQGSFLQADVVQRTGISPRTLQFWVNGGLLKPTTPNKKAGTGVHRRYSADELEIAAILAELSRLGISTGALRGIADWIRSIQKVGQKFGTLGHSAAERFLRVQRYLREKDLTDPNLLHNVLPESDHRAHLGLTPSDPLPRGKPSIDESQEAKIYEWIEYDRARNPRWDSGENIVLKIGLAEDEKWFGVVGYGAIENVERDDRFQSFNSILIVKLSRIFQKLWATEAEGASV